jgi:exopolysaccharide biosynthesis polyprenyl glycosylphosphotransferase
LKSQRAVFGLITFMELVCDSLGIVCGFVLAHRFLGNRLSEGNQAPLLIGLLILFVFLWNKLYVKHKTILNIEETRLILKSLLISFLVVLSLLFLSQENRNEAGTLSFLTNAQHQLFNMGFDRSLSRMELILSFVLMFPIISLFRYFVFKVGQLMHRKGFGNDRVLIYGQGELARYLSEKIKQSPKSGYFLVDSISEYDNLQKICTEKKIDRLMVADAGIDSDRLVQIMRLAEKMGVALEFVPAMHTLFVHRIRLGDIDGLPLISLHNSSLSTSKKIFKYVFDMILALIFLLILSPLFFLIAIGIRLQSKGPVFFKQQRSGINGRPFTVFKFRSMKEGSEAYAPTPSSSDEERITGLGRILRRFSLDELPQLINVLRGEMSLVGPRPEMPFITEKYGPLAKERLRIKPGITGLWQISADRELEIHENLDYDLYYIEHQGLLLDVVILIRTFFSVIRGIGSY